MGWGHEEHRSHFVGGSRKTKKRPPTPPAPSCLGQGERSSKTKLAPKQKKPRPQSNPAPKQPADANILGKNGLRQEALQQLPVPGAQGALQAPQQSSRGHQGLASARAPRVRTRQPKRGGLEARASAKALGGTRHSDANRGKGSKKRRNKKSGTPGFRSLSWGGQQAEPRSSAW